MDMKICYKCRVEKKIQEFYKNMTSPDGHRIRCKTCDNELRRLKYKTDELFREQRKKESRESGRRCREKKLRYMSEIYYPMKREERLIYLEQWRNDNRKKISDGLKRYRESEVGKIADSKKHARRKRGLGFNILFKSILDEPIAWHHINDNDVVAIPKDIHEFFTLNNAEKHRENLNPIVKQLYPDYKWDE